MGTVRVMMNPFSERNGRASNRPMSPLDIAKLAWFGDIERRILKSMKSNNLREVIPIDIANFLPPAPQLIRQSDAPRMGCIARVQHTCHHAR